MTDKEATVERFKVFSCDNIKEHITAEQYEYLQPIDQYDYIGFLVDTQTRQVVGQDGGEPEDQLLIRDWDWVAPLLNDVATEARTDKEPKRIAYKGNQAGFHYYECVSTGELYFIPDVEVQVQPAPGTLTQTTGTHDS